MNAIAGRRESRPPAPRADAGRLPLLAVLAVMFLVRLPFLTQAVQGDDPSYLAAAEHALTDPLHPYHMRYVVRGEAVDMRGFSHPPGNAWFLAVLMKAAGDVSETAFHGCYLLFSFVATVSMWSLARRFSPHPMWATLLLLAMPAFVISGNSLEADLPLLACWLAAVALFVGARYKASAAALAMAALFGYQAVFLTPILWIYLLLTEHKIGRTAGEATRLAWIVTLVPVGVCAAWQTFEYFSGSEFPLRVLAGYLRAYHLESAGNKMHNAAALLLHLCFLVFPVLLPAAATLGWKARRRPDIQFLLVWIGLFFSAALALFYAGGARYLLPIAAPVVLLVSRLPRKWLIAGFAAQLTLSSLLALVNYRHWERYRQFAAYLRPQTRNRRVWINAEWGLRYYLESDGGLPLERGQVVRPGDVVVTSELSAPVVFTQPVELLMKAEIRPANHLRLIGLDSQAGYTDASRGLLPFGISRGPIDRVRAEVVLSTPPQ